MNRNTKSKMHLSPITVPVRFVFTSSSNCKVKVNAEQRPRHHLCIKSAIITAIFITINLAFTHSLQMTAKYIA